MCQRKGHVNALYCSHLNKVAGGSSTPIPGASTTINSPFEQGNVMSALQPSGRRFSAAVPSPTPPLDGVSPTSSSSVNQVVIERQTPSRRTFLISLQPFTYENRSESSFVEMAMCPIQRLIQAPVASVSSTSTSLSKLEVEGTQWLPQQQEVAVWVLLDLAEAPRALKSLRREISRMEA